MIISFTQWTPDRPSVAKGRLRIVENAIPALESYEPLADLASISDPLSAACLGLVSARDPAAGTHIFAGDASKLYEYTSSGAWTDVSIVGGYTTSSTGRWRFTQYGDRMIAVNGTDAVQYFDMTTSTDFDDLAGSPPVAKFAATYGEFVILGWLASSAFKIRWSAIGDSETWTIGVNQADEQEFPDGGEVTGLAVADVLYVFQESAIRRVSYIGMPVIMQIDVVEQGRGCMAPGSLAQLGRMFFYLSEDGFYQFDGLQSAPIGLEKVDEWFKADARRDYFYTMSAGVDPLNKLYLLAYASNASSLGVPDTLLMFNWAIQSWSYARVGVEALAQVLTPGLTLEELDAIYGDLDSIPFSLDDPLLTGGTLKLAAVNTSHELAYFAGDALEATFETDDIIAGENSLLFCRAARPLIDADCYVSVGARMRLADTISYSSESITNASGLAPLRSTGRYVRINLRIPEAAAWTKAEGFELDATPMGAR